jgi:4-amino-4-deoxy-L-arabinose transferase-like glycosyltransferase
MELIKLIKNNLLFLIILIGFIVRSFYFYYNDDAQVYVLWLKHFINTGELLTIDHPPLFFIISAIVVKIILTLLSFGNVVYWLMGLLSVVAVLKTKKLNLHLKLIISLSLTYLWFVGYYLKTYEIVATISFFFGVLAIYIIYKLGEVLFDKSVGILASLLLSLSWWHIIYSKIPLIDCFATTLILWGVYEYIKFLKKVKVEEKDLLVPTLSLTLALYSKYYAPLILLTLFYFLLTWYKRKKITIYGLPLLISLIIFGFWVLFTNFYLREHYALTHYFFIEFPSKAAFLTFFAKSLTLPIFLLFLLSFTIFILNKPDLQKNSFLLLNIFIPTITYFKYTYIDGTSHTLINLSNYMLPALPFIYLFIASQLNFIGRKFNLEFNLELLILLFILFFSLIFTSLDKIFLEYDKNYKTIKGNLDSVLPEDVKKISFNLPTLHYVYNFVGVNIFHTKLVQERIIHYRWSSPTELTFYSLNQTKINLTLSAKAFCNTKLLVTNGVDGNLIPLTNEWKKVNLSLILPKGKYSLHFKSINGDCICISKECVNFIIEDKSYEIIS